MEATKVPCFFKLYFYRDNKIVYMMERLLCTRKLMRKHHNSGISVFGRR
jgi:hypothetical protein